MAAKTLASGKVLVTSEAIRASGWLHTEYDPTALSPAFSATLRAGATVDLVPAEAGPAR